jgi:demethylspheroidene O-methyltransferase
MGLGARAVAMGADGIRGPLPRGADLISFVRVLHDHDDVAVLAFLRNARAALAPGGTLLIAEPLAGTKGAEPIGDAYFGFYFLAMGQGRARTRDGLSALVQQAGFGKLREHSTHLPMLVRVLTASPIGVNEV